MAIINTLYNTNPYQDKIMGGVQGDPNPFGYQNQINDFVIDNEPYQEIPGYNFIDAPTSLKSRLTNRQFFNNPAVQNPFEKAISGIETLTDKAKSGVGKGFDLGKTALNGILSAITGVPFLGNALTGITSQFENRPLGASVIDEFGNVYDPEDLNKQNALGGYYTDAARSSRRRTSRISKMLERQKLGKKISLKNLAKLQAQEAAQEAARERATKSMAAANKAAGTGGYQAGYDSGFMDGPSGASSGMGAADKGGSDSMGSFKNGGLAGLL